MDNFCHFALLKNFRQVQQSAYLEVEFVFSNERFLCITNKALDSWSRLPFTAATTIYCQQKRWRSKQRRLESCQSVSLWLCGLALSNRCSNWSWSAKFRNAACVETHGTGRVQSMRTWDCLIQAWPQAVATSNICRSNASQIAFFWFKSLNVYPLIGRFK